MRKILVLAVVTLLGMTTTNAQVKFGFGFGYAVPSGDIADITDGGLSAHLELGYGVTENIDVSILWQGDFLTGADVQINDIQSSVSYGAVALGSFLVNGRYFFTDTKFKPYGSLGLGLATIGSIEIESNITTVQGNVGSTSNFAFRPAVGFKYGVLNMNAAYLNAGKVGDTSISDFTVNIGLLFTFGGQ